MRGSQRSSTRYRRCDRDRVFCASLLSRNLPPMRDISRSGSHRFRNSCRRGLSKPVPGRIPYSLACAALVSARCRGRQGAMTTKFRSSNHLSEKGDRVVAPGPARGLRRGQGTARQLDQDRHRRGWSFRLSAAPSVCCARPVRSSCCEINNLFDRYAQDVARVPWLHASISAIGHTGSLTAFIRSRR